MASCMADREEHLCMAKLAEQVGRYDDMMNSMTKYVSELSATEELTEEEFTLLCIAYRKVMEPLRASWLRIYSIEQKEELHGNNEHAKMAKESRCRIEGEISEICYGILKLLDVMVLVRTKSFGQSKVVYLTVKGDYYRYLAKDIADTELDPIHRLRLGLAVNFSVFYYEILNQSERACNVAKQAIEAITELTTLGEESDNEDITLILRLLNQNLTMWKSDMH
nr:hypothetical protein [Tanacetum cinerariifolium]